MKKFLEEIVKTVENNLPEDMKDICKIELNEVIKGNDIKLHALIINNCEKKIAPAIYLENHYEEYLKGRGLEDIASDIVNEYNKASKDAPSIGEISLEYEDIRDKVVARVFEADRNKEWLKDRIHCSMDNGMAAVVYIVLKENDDGVMQFALTNEIAKKKEYDMDMLMKDAFDNTIKRYEPSFICIEDMLLPGEKLSYETNPNKEDFKINQSAGMYVLSNKDNYYGAGTMFYPDMQKRIGDIVKEDYYVLPSSIHELIIVPSSIAPGIDNLRSMVAEANKTVVDPREVLSDKVFLYSRARDRLVDTMSLERKEQGRGER